MRKKKMSQREVAPSGMCPYMTKPVLKKKKKPNPYRAPNTIKRYYAGINYGIDLLKDELLALIDDEQMQTIIKDKAKHLKISTSKKLTDLEKMKTKQKLKEWEDKEWESI